MVWANPFKIATPTLRNVAPEFWLIPLRARANWGSWGLWELCGVRRGSDTPTVNDHFQVKFARVEAVPGGLDAPAGAPEARSGVPAPWPEGSS